MMNPQYQSIKSGKLHSKHGPQSPLGHRWIGFLRSGPNQFGIHGTPWPHWVKTKAAVSNGCVRILNAHVQQLYDHVELGMAVEITPCPPALIGLAPVQRSPEGSRRLLDP